MTVSAVVFDVGNVLLEWDPKKLFDPEIGSERREKLFTETGIHNMNLDVDRGAPFRETVYGLAGKHPEWGDEIRMWHDRWIEMAQPAIDHSARLLRALRKNGVPVFALTNFGRETFAFAKTRYDVLNEFDREFVSAHLNTIKPEPRIYEIVEQESGLAPETLLFADDSEDNIAAAKARGWQTHLFDQPQPWADRLVAEGLLTAEQAT